MLLPTCCSQNFGCAEKFRISISIQSCKLFFNQFEIVSIFIFQVGNELPLLPRLCAKNFFVSKKLFHCLHDRVNVHPLCNLQQLEFVPHFILTLCHAAYMFRQGNGFLAHTFCNQTRKHKVILK